MYEDDFELKQGIDEDIAKILLDLQEKHNIYFTKSKTWMGLCRKFRITNATGCYRVGSIPT